MPDFLHDRRDFGQLVALVADERRIDPVLVEKDYWIMHCLWGLQAQGFSFELKGGTSLSKGFGVIHRFSEDIDIRIEPPAGMPVKTGRNQDKPAHVDSRRAFYDWLAAEIKIPGIKSSERDTAFDDEKLRSAGISLSYPTVNKALAGVKTGILLELGFDDTAPNQAVTISSWTYDKAVERGVKIADNRALDVACYAPTHTFVEKLQTISTKYRRLAESDGFPKNFLRHYYDVFCLLDMPEVRAFLGSACPWASFLAGLAAVRFMLPVTTMSVEQMHQRAGQQQQVGPGTRYMIPVFAQQIEASDQRHHQQRCAPGAGPLVRRMKRFRLQCVMICGVVHADLLQSAVRVSTQNQHGPSYGRNVKCRRVCRHPRPEVLHSSYCHPACMLAM